MVVRGDFLLDRAVVGQICEDKGPTALRNLLGLLVVGECPGEAFVEVFEVAAEGHVVHPRDERWVVPLGNR